MQINKPNDNSLSLIEQVKIANAKSRALNIKGSGSKDFYGHSSKGELINLSTHCGIMHYQPTELVLQARAGTPLKEIQARLKKNGQYLSCEPPHFGNNATFGGMIATGLSGPGRPFNDSIADLILGCTILNGKGETLRFGGKVMKNVAGYDVSRLMVGGMGCLGIILDATIKVMPKAPSQRTFRFNISNDKIKSFINNLCLLGFPVSASAYDNSFNTNCLLVRFDAGKDEISQLDSLLQQEFKSKHYEEEPSNQYWQDLREQKLNFFNTSEDIWRISIAPDNIDLAIKGESIIGWNGGIHWLKTKVCADEIFSHVASIGGHATLFRYSESASPKEIFQPLPAPLFEWHKRLKQSFDPASIFNPGRMYKDL